MDVEGAKNLYENITMISDHLADDVSTIGTDALANVLLSLTGMTRIGTNGHVGLDVRTRDQANRVAVRWLRTNGYLPRR